MPVIAGMIFVRVEKREQIILLHNLLIFSIATDATDDCVNITHENK